MPLIWKQAVGENWKGFNLNVVRWKKKMKALKSCWNGQQKWELQTQQLKTLLALATVWAILSPSLISRRQVGELQTELCLFEWNIYNFSCIHIIFLLLQERIGCRSRSYKRRIDSQSSKNSLIYCWMFIEKWSETISCC